MSIEYPPKYKLRETVVYKGRSYMLVEGVGAGKWFMSLLDEPRAPHIVAHQKYFSKREWTPREERMVSGDIGKAFNDLFDHLILNCPDKSKDMLRNCEETLWREFKNLKNLGDTDEERRYGVDMP